MSFGAICGVSLTSLTAAGTRVLREDLAHVGGATQWHWGGSWTNFSAKQFSFFYCLLNFSKRTNKAFGSSRLSGQCQNKISQKRNKMGGVILGYGYTITFLFTQVKMEIDLTKGGVSDASGNILDCVFFLSLHR